MSKKDNFNKAMYDMFGVGNEGESREKVSADTAAAAEPAPRPKEDPQPVRTPRPAYKTTVLAEGSYFEGTLKAKGDVDLACSFKGDIFSDGKVTMRTNLDGNVSGNCIELCDCKVVGKIRALDTLTISSASKVNGDITAKNLYCSGDITGNIIAGGHVTLTCDARLKGDLTAAVLSIEEGAVIEGNIKVVPAKK